MTEVKVVRPKGAKPLGIPRGKADPARPDRRWWLALAMFLANTKVGYVFATFLAPEDLFGDLGWLLFPGCLSGALVGSFLWCHLASGVNAEKRFQRANLFVLVPTFLCFVTGVGVDLLAKKPTLFFMLTFTLLGGIMGTLNYLVFRNLTHSDAEG